MVASRKKRAPPAATISGASSKRRGGRPRKDVAINAGEPTADAEAEASRWVYLQADLVRLVGIRLLEDGDGGGLLDAYARFHPARWVMLPEGHGIRPGHRKLRGRVRFFNLSTAAVVIAKLPLFRDHYILDTVDGLLLLQRDQDTAVRLLKPLTGDIAELPPLSSITPSPSLLAFHDSSRCSDGLAPPPSA